MSLAGCVARLVPEFAVDERLVIAAAHGEKHLVLPPTGRPLATESHG
jgi:hypothetical protein